jgi:hypothetical protein
MAYHTRMAVLPDDIQRRVNLYLTCIAYYMIGVML